MKGRPRRVLSVAGPFRSQRAAARQGSGDDDEEAGRGLL